MSLLAETLSGIRPASSSVREAATSYIKTLTMPEWALGRILDLAVDLAGMTGELRPELRRKRIILMAADHGIVAEGVCPQDSEVTTQMVCNFVSGGAGVNVLARVAQAEVTIVDMGLKTPLPKLVEAGLLLDGRQGYGTDNFAKGPAMTREQAQRTIEFGIQTVLNLNAQTDVFATGEMGIGNTSPSSAIVTVLAHESDPAPYVGRGAGLAAERLAHKSAVIRRGIELNQPDPDDALDILSKVGGFEIGGIAGVILGAAYVRKPVVVDGFISSAGALLAAALAPESRDYMILAHGSAEPGHLKMAELLQKSPLLDLGLRLGEGSGAALAMPLIDGAGAIMSQMATFETAQVTRRGLYDK